MSRLRESNDGALQDYLDGTLPGLHPGSPDPEEHYGGDRKREGKTLLKEQTLKRLDDPGRQASHQMLLRLMVSPDSRLAGEDPLAHSALSQFVFGSPAGYVALTEMEYAAHRGGEGSPAGYIAARLRRGYERVLDYLDEERYQLVVASLPAQMLREAKQDADRQERARAEFIRQLRKRGRDRRAVTSAIKATALQTGYDRRSIERLTHDLRAGELRSATKHATFS